MVGVGPKISLRFDECDARVIGRSIGTHVLLLSPTVLPVFVETTKKGGPLVDGGRRSGG